MSRNCQLIMVTEDNHNKFYNMSEENGEIHVTYGRVGCRENHINYPMSKWESLYNSKIRKGYEEVTEYKSESKTVTFSLDDKEIESLVKTLITKARNKIADNYLVSYTQVTQAQIDEAQRILDSVLEYRTKRVEIDELNRRLLSLYKVLPRKMGKVKDYLIDENDVYIDGRFDTTRIKEIIRNEQDLLDTMATQVQQQVDVDTEDEEVNVLEAAGLTMENITKKEEKTIKDLLGNNKNQFVRAFKVTNKGTQNRFDKCLKDSDNQKTELLWHGSRTENWWSILSTGLMIRPSNAVYTGSMFGDALYFATKAQKSIGYTSLSNSYWASGRDSKAYLALFEVHVGEQKHIHTHTYSCYDLTYNKIHNEGYDSVFAHAGRDLRNDELMVYRPDQCTVKYIVEISN